MTLQLSPEDLRQGARSIDTSVSDQEAALKNIMSTVQGIAGSAFQGATANALLAKVQELTDNDRPLLQDAREKSQLLSQQADAQEQAESDQASQMHGLQA